MRVSSVFRYPLKSMRGESCTPVRVRVDGLVGDRKLALLDVERGTVVSGKNPRRWPTLREFAAFETDRGVVVRTPDGSTIAVDDADADHQLSRALDRPVRILRRPPSDSRIERLWPDTAGLAPEAVRAASVVVDGPDVTAGPLGIFAPGTFFDVAPVHVVFAASLRHLERLVGTELGVRRFRPNLVIESEHAPCFVEDQLMGAQLRLGPELIVRIEHPSPRCIVPTLAGSDEDIAKSPALLPALVEHHRVGVAGLGKFACFGAYASVVRPGTVAVDDAVKVCEPESRESDDLRDGTGSLL